MEWNGVDCFVCDGVGDRSRMFVVVVMCERERVVVVEEVRRKG